MPLRIVLASLLLALLAAADAGACSCVGFSPAERMAEADAAFIGKVTAVRSEEDPDGSNPTFVRRVRVYTVQVEKAYKGDVGATAEVRGEDMTGDGPMTSCGVHFDVGDELGGFFRGAPQEWFVHSCNQADRETLEQGAKGFPKPTGSGTVVALLAGPFADAPFAALDARGRVVAYARGRSSRGFGGASIDPCPGGRHAVVASPAGVHTYRLRDLTATRKLSKPAYSARCVDAAGRIAIVSRPTRIDRVTATGARTLARRRWQISAPGPVVSVVAGEDGAWLIDSRSGRRRALRGVPHAPRAVSVSPDGGHVAVLGMRRIAVFTASGRRVRTGAAGSRPGAIVWSARGRATALPRERFGAARVGDAYWWTNGERLHSARAPRAGSRLLGTVPENGFGSQVVALPAPVAVSDPSRFTPPGASAASAGSPPRARRARAEEGAPRDDCPRA